MNDGAVMLEEEKTIHLIKPIVEGEGAASITWTDLRLREPLAWELEKASKEKTNIGSSITLISIIAQWPRSVVEKLCQRDIQAANVFLASFSKDGDETEKDGDD
jgi:hypothetical protein